MGQSKSDYAEIGRNWDYSRLKYSYFPQLEASEGNISKKCLCLCLGAE